MHFQFKKGDRVRVAIDMEGKHVRSYHGTVKGVTVGTGMVRLTSDDGKHKSVNPGYCTLIPPAALPTLAGGFIQWSTHLQQQPLLTDLQNLKAYQQFEAVSSDPRRLAKLLLNCWSAEYALRITPMPPGQESTMADDERYLRHTLQWTFPQAYYSTLFSARAFLSLTDFTQSDEASVGRMVSRYVWRSHYPAGLDMYLAGPPQAYEANRRRLGDQVVFAFLTDTRDNQIKALRSVVQRSPDTALISQRTGRPIAKFGPEQYKVLSTRAGFTTWFNLMARLRISDTNRDLAILGDDIDVLLLHRQLIMIVSAVNTVHEAYVLRSLGTDAYQKILQSIPQYLQNSFLRDRFNQFSTIKHIQ